jgi:pyruvate/2-oxoglutarate/acetoin dehydrogenase E1 component
MDRAMERKQLDECILAVAETAEYLYTEFTPTTCEYKRGTRPLLESVVKTGRAVVVHEAPRTNGFGAEIVALINEHALLQLEAPVQRVAGFDVVFPLAQNEKLYLPSRDRIIAAVQKTLDF